MINAENNLFLYATYLLNYFKRIVECFPQNEKLCYLKYLLYLYFNIHICNIYYKYFTHWDPIMNETLNQSILSNNLYLKKTGVIYLYSYSANGLCC